MSTFTEQDLPWLAPALHQLLQPQRSHALILHGAAGSGLFELALRAAQAWLCEAPGPGGLPCDQCAACHLALAHSHADLRVVMPEAEQLARQWQASADAEGEGDSESRSKRKPSREIKVEAIRQAIDWAHTSSGRGRGKVLVFHPADAMNLVSANALLKTLEEPAPGVRLLLCVDNPERLLPTIRSRCQRLRLDPPPVEQALAWLRRGPLPEPEVMLHAAGGEPLAALALAQAGMTAELWTQLPAQVAAGEVRGLAVLPLPQALRALQCLCHDLLAVHVQGHARYFPGTSLPQGLALPALTAWGDQLRRAARHDEHPWHAPLLLESLVAEGQSVMLPHRAARRPPGAGVRRPAPR
ncbi:DNA polymerase III subunit delta' [Ideonella livida]|uniref:DNA polymerase III subunit delta n=1 Tax=Ideonella livida TaxID=2707176 RepID=A0A7C9PFP0_9BURK|nr:DNA polymerase III subunit delta' [Ideonella livida]NDY90528.1 DNA polymerase III subunit delta' [Ideonella livida]